MLFGLILIFLKLKDFANLNFQLLLKKKDLGGFSLLLVGKHEWDRRCQRPSTTSSQVWWKPSVIIRPSIINCCNPTADTTAQPQLLNLNTWHYNPLISDSPVTTQISNILRATCQMPSCPYLQVHRDDPQWPVDKTHVPVTLCFLHRSNSFYIFIQHQSYTYQPKKNHL